MFEAIIFDMDGVIVDTEMVHYERLNQFLDVEQRTVSKEEQMQVLGSSANRFFCLVASFLGEDVSIEEAKNRLEAFNHNYPHQMDYLKIFRQEIQMIFDYARNHHLKVGLASSSPMSTIQKVLEVCQIKANFDYVVSGEIFKESKPNPEIYFYIAGKLEVAPEKCLVVEDSYYGIQAAKRAGMTVIAYQEERLLVDQSSADYRGQGMSEILDVIISIQKDREK